MNCNPSNLRDWVDLATVIGGFATGITMIVAIVGGLIAYYQITSQRKMQNEALTKQREMQGEAIAKNLYMKYLQDAMQRPDFFEPNFGKLTAQNRLVEYGLFVAHLLFSCEELLANAADPEWEETIRAQLLRHKDYLDSDHFKLRQGHYSSQLIEIVDSVTGT